MSEDLFEKLNHQMDVIGDRIEAAALVQSTLSTKASKSLQDEVDEELEVGDPNKATAKVIVGI